MIKHAGSHGYTRVRAGTRGFARYTRVRAGTRAYTRVHAGSCGFMRVRVLRPNAQFVHLAHKSNGQRNGQNTPQAKTWVRAPGRSDTRVHAGSRGYRRVHARTRGFTRVRVLTLNLIHWTHKRTEEVRRMDKIRRRRRRGFGRVDDRTRGLARGHARTFPNAYFDTLNAQMDRGVHMMDEIRQKFCITSGGGGGVGMAGRRERWELEILVVVTRCLLLLTRTHHSYTTHSVSLGGGCLG